MPLLEKPDLMGRERARRRPFDRLGMECAVGGREGKRLNPMQLIASLDAGSPVVVASVLRSSDIRIAHIEYRCDLDLRARRPDTWTQSSLSRRRYHWPSTLSFRKTP